MMTIAQGKELVLPDLTFEETGSTVIQLPCELCQTDSWCMRNEYW